MKLQTQIKRFIMLGPLAGFLGSVCSTGAALLVWLSFDQPDFYFRGPQGVVVHALLMIILYGFAGMFQGGLILLLENRLNRYPNIPIFILLQPLILFLLYSGVINIAFTRNEIFWNPLLEQVIFLVVGVLLWISLPKRSDTKPI